MTLFPIARPTLGLSITSESVSLVEIQRQWRGGTIRRIAQESLPSDVIQFSPAKPNIIDTKAFSESLRLLVKGLKPPQPIALSLPDLCARMAALEFTSFPKKPLEREAILNWRFQQDFNISTTNSRLAYSVYEPKKSKKTPPNENGNVIRVFATAIQHAIIEQYEELSLQAGLLPLTVGISSLDVFDLYRQTIQESIETASNRSRLSSTELFFLHLTDWGFFFAAFRDDFPVFVRAKSLRFPQANQHSPEQERSGEFGSPQASAVSDQDITDASDSHDHAREHISDKEKSFASGASMMVANELVATFQYYFESFPTTTWEGTTLPLFFAEGVQHGATLLPDIQEIEQMLKSSMADPPPIAIISLPDRLTKHVHANSSISPYMGLNALPAYASVMVV